MTLTHKRAALEAEAEAELRSDLSDLGALVHSVEDRLGRVARQIEASSRWFEPRTLRTHLAQLGSARDALGYYAQELDRAVGARSSVETLRAQKTAGVDLIRMQVSVAAALQTAADWQSPPIRGSNGIRSGRFSGLVREHCDDYKRDRHADAAEFEAAYVREYVDVPPAAPVRAIMTSCGMSAFATILGYLTMQPVLASGPVLVMRELYHECRDLLATSSLANRLVWVDGSETTALFHAVEKLKPAAIFLDSYCNSRGITVPDLSTLLPALRHVARRKTFVVIDNTGLSVAFQPIPSMLGAPALRPLVFESLSKLAQFGLDRTAAGMIVALEEEAEGLSEYREHLGANIADACVWMVPSPDRERFERRLARLGRNAGTLAGAIEDAAPKGSRVRPYFPGLPSHPCHAHIPEGGFPGTFFELRVGPDPPTPEEHVRLMEALVEEASSRGVLIACGASFGFDVTRLYRTATRSAHGPFLRIAPGTEDRGALERLCDVFRAVVRSA